jgi:hypothetical protein
MSHFDTWSGSGTLSARIDADPSAFTRLSRNGAAVGSRNYSVTQGSTIITLHENFLFALSDAGGGNFAFVAEFSNGRSEELHLVIPHDLFANSQDNDPEYPPTQDTPESPTLENGGSSSSTGLTAVERPGGGSGGSGSGGGRSGFFGGSTSITIFGEEMLLFAPLGARSWSVLNLTLGGVGALLIIGNILRAIRRKRLEIHRPVEDITIYSEEMSRDAKRMSLWVSVSSVAGFLGVFFFLLFQDRSNAMVLMDFWTAVHLLIFIVQAISTVLAFAKGKEVTSDIAEIENRVPVLT